jgi:hypothetical protein
VKKPTGNSGGRCPGLVWVLAAFGLYLLFFMAEPMQSLGGALRRGQWIGMYLLLPDMLVSQWFPSPAARCCSTGFCRFGQPWRAGRSRHVGVRDPGRLAD